jgi:formamidopyrimidine-DNA glycosylase
VPELPDLTVYQEHLAARIANRRLLRVRLLNPFLLRTAVPPVSAVEGKKVEALLRVGKRIVLALEGELYLESGALTLTEAGTKRRASLHLLQGKAALDAMDPGGIEVLESTAEDFATRLTRDNHTLKRALTDPRLFAGIGNAYSDEILHRAKLSPIALTQQLSPQEIDRLFAATREVLREWIDRLRSDAASGFPEKVTAFREEMAVHGRYGKPCPVCGAPVQRIVYAENETNYCARCQTGGKILADRALSRLLKKSWPRSIP